jgi:hypothetical protein
MRKAAAILVCLALALAAQAAWAGDSLEVDGAMVWIGNADANSAPSPLLPAVGMNFPLVQRRFFGIDTGFLLTGTYYEYASGRAVPAELEHRGYAVVAVLGDARAGLRVPIGSKAELGLNAGLLLFLRLPIPLFPDASEDFGNALVYLLARSLYPEAELSFRFPILPSFDLRLAARAGLPWFHLWDGEPYAFWDQMVLTGVLGVVYRFPPKDQANQTKS